MLHTRKLPLPLSTFSGGGLLSVLLSAACGASACGDSGNRDMNTDIDASTDVGIDAALGCATTSETRTETSSGMRVVHHNGQSYVSWLDRAEAEAGEAYRYHLYRSSSPIENDDDLVSAELVASNILNHSAQLFGEAFIPSQRLNAESHMAIVEAGSAPLPVWSGLWVATTKQSGCAYYAVIASDADGGNPESVQPGVNASVDPVAEIKGEREPLKVFDSNERGKYTPQTRITNTANLPLLVSLHASSAQGGGAGDYGDYYNYFADETMGYQDGLPGVFSVRETHSGPQYLEMRNRDTIVKPDGSRGVETHWFGYLADPENGEGKHAYPYTEARLLWMIPWTIEHYEVDPERVYCTGGSMGAWGSMSFAFRHPELFAAVYPNRPRFYQRSLATIVDSVADVDTLPDGLQWQTHHDSVAFVRQHPEDLPFLGWNVGRNDGFATWQEQIDMVTALEAGHHGFAFAWNNGDHSSGTNSDAGIRLWYPQDKFAKNLSYPAFANSSINNNLGNGDPTNGELEGGINLGFDWTVEGDTQTEWILLLRNDLAELAMTVDITPRRLQSFSLTAGESISYEVSRGGTSLSSGSLTADANGLLTLPAVALQPKADTRIRFSR